MGDLRHEHLSQGGRGQNHGPSIRSRLSHRQKPGGNHQGSTPELSSASLWTKENQPSILESFLVAQETVVGLLFSGGVPGSFPCVM